MGIINLKKTVRLSMESTFIKPYPRRDKKGSISDEGRSYQLAEIPHGCLSALPIAMHAAWQHLPSKPRNKARFIPA